MPMIISSADLRNQYADISRKVHETGEPVFVTKNGKGDVAILSMETYDRMMGIIEAREKVLKGLDSIKRGDVAPAEDVLSEARSLIE